MAPTENTLLLEEVRLIYRNFAGRETAYNREGDRNFSAIIPSTEIAQQMEEDGWNVKWLKPREDEEADDAELTAHLPIGVSFKVRPPNVVMITSRGRTQLDESSIEALDWADIISADLIVRPYQWSVQGKTGIKAYLKSLFVKIDEDELELKYAELDRQ